MERMARLIGVLCLCIALAQAHREAAVETLLEPRSPANVGRVAGQRAGARAGAAAGAVAAETALEAAEREKTVTEFAEPGFPRVLRAAADASLVPAAPQVASENPGAVNFFRQFDADGDDAWTRQEWDAAIDRAISMRYLPGSFDRDGQWEALEKNDVGFVSLQTFLNWTAKTPAHQPPKKFITVPPKYTIIKSYKFSNCEDAFGLYDSNHDGVWDLQEFSKAVNGRVADDHIASKWHTLPKKGAGDDKLDLTTWVDFCVALTGLPRGPAGKPLRKPACASNPCKESGTICMEDPQVCLVGFDCPQYRCIKSTTRIASPFARAYDNCTSTFAKFDLNKDNRLSEEEFRTGVHFGRGVSFPGKRRFNVVKTWAHFSKDAENMVSLYEFVHFCVAVTEEGNDDGGVAKSECWDVFNQFDVDSSVDLSETEFDRGMMRAKQHGHVPVDMKIKRVWKALPKNAQNNRVSAGSFIKWCLDVSRGVEAEAAARSILAPAGVVPFPSTIASLIRNTTVTNETLVIGWKNGSIVQSWINGSVLVHHPNGSNESYALPVYGVMPTVVKPFTVSPTVSNEITGSQIQVPTTKAVIGAGTPLKVSTVTSPTTAATTPTVVSPSTPSITTNAVKTKSKNVLNSLAASISGLVNGIGLGAAASVGAVQGTGYPVSEQSPEFCVKLFQLGDTNKDGFLRVDEFQSICEDLYTQDHCQRFPAIFFNADSNRNQRLEPAEFSPLCKAAPKFEGSQASMVDAKKNAVTNAAAAGKAAGEAAGEAAGRRAGEQAADLTALPYHNFRSVEPAPVLTDEDVSKNLESIDPADLD